MKRLTITVSGFISDQEFAEDFAPQVPGESIADRLNREAASGPPDANEMRVLAATVEEIAPAVRPLEAPSI